VSEPEKKSHKKSGNSAKWYPAYLSFIILLVVYGLSTGHFGKRYGFTQYLEQWLGPGTQSILGYLYLGPWCTALLFAIAGIFCRKWLDKSQVGCLPVWGVVYIIQVGAYWGVKGFDWRLLLPLSLVVVWAICAGVYWLRDAFGKKECVKCGRPGHFVLSSATPKSSGKQARYCLTHFIDSLGVSLKRRKGSIIVVDRQDGETKAGHYFFYDPADLLLDSMPQSDVDAVNSLLELAFGRDSGNTDELRVVKITGGAVKRIGSFDDQPLLLVPPDHVPMTAMDPQDLLPFFKTALADFDAPGREFHMNRPYSNRGIYIWHDYI
jgi:hypothetical protein